MIQQAINKALYAGAAVRTANKISKDREIRAGKYPKMPTAYTPVKPDIIPQVIERPKQQKKVRKESKNWLLESMDKSLNKNIIRKGGKSTYGK